MNYSLREVRAYLGAIARVQNDSAADNLELGFFAAQRSGADVVKVTRALRRR